MSGVKARDYTRPAYWAERVRTDAHSLVMYLSGVLAQNPDAVSIAIAKRGIDEYLASIRPGGEGDGVDGVRSGSTSSPSPSATADRTEEDA